MLAHSFLLLALSTPVAVLSKSCDVSRISNEPRAVNSGDVMIQLFEWNWDSISAECTNFIGPAGYKYVQVSTAQEHITGSQWWTSYQAVSYKIQSKRGSRDQFQKMVSACKSAGVGVLSDVVVNHMAGIDSGTGVAGTSFTHYSYPSYTTDDFHYCGTPGNDIQNWNDGWQVQNCELSNLADLKTESSKVRSTVAAHLKDLLSLGVAGFRIDAAKHVPAADLSTIVSSAGKAQYITQEVVYGSGNVQPSDYQGIGDVTEFTFKDTVTQAFLGTNGKSLSSLKNIGGSGYLQSGKANVFIATHDSERGLGDPDNLTANSPSNMYTNAHVFMLAYPYGHPTVLSSYKFTNKDDGAPNGGYGSCNNGANGFRCQHRWTQISSMVKFRLTAGTAAVSDWVSPQSNQIAFGRGPAGFVAINNADSNWSSTFKTSVADGKYCEVISACATKITVKSGSFTVTVPKRGSIAIHKGSKL